MAEKNKIIKVKDYPYNFVSLGENVINKGERVLGKNTGILKCKLRTYSPLFIMGDRDVSENGHSKEYFLKENGNYIIPSSTLKGEIRTIIEVLTNSVIRNVETERLEKRLSPGKFSPLFGIIEKLPTDNEDGEIKLAKKFKLKKEVAYNIVKGKDLSEGGMVKLRFKNSLLKDYEKNYKFESKEEFMEIYTSKTENSSVGILWVTSNIGRKKYEKILVKDPSETIYRFSKEEYEDFKYIVAQRIEREKKDKKRFYLGDSGNYELKVGDPIIFEKIEKGHNIKHLAFSEIPRLRYKLSPWQLIPLEFRPSNSLKNLSFSERLFGTTGNHNEKSESKELTSISGRVFFTDAKLDENKAKFVDEKPKILKPFGEPHPTLLSFYLEKDGSYDKQGSKIRGRKFYWHHKDKIEKKFETYSKSITMNSQERYNASLQLLDFGNEFEFEIHFNNLTDDELGVLTYALELEEGLLHKVGKGKAFGFGSCKIEIKETLLKNENKYNGFSISKVFKENKEIQEIKQKCIKKAKEMYIDEKRKNIKELKIILSKENFLDFSKSPFPEEEGNTPGKNTLNWFMNKKKKGEVILKTILEIDKDKK